MNYQLNRDGLNLGEFSLDELRRGRAAGKFDGRELVWAEGMAQWQPLEGFLREKFPPGLTPPPIPLSPQQKRNRIIAWTAGIIGALFIGGAILVGYGVLKFVERVQQYSGMAVRPDASAAANQPVIVSTNSLTEADQQMRRRDFRVRQWRDGYEQNGDHNAACDAEVRRLLEVWIQENYDAGNATNSETAQELADRLVNTPGCEDPIMLTVAGVEATELGEAISRLELAVTNFEGSRHTAYPKFYATVMLADKLGSRSDRLPALDEAATQHLREGFADGSFMPDDAQALAEILLLSWGDGFYVRNAPALCELIPKDKDPSFEWLGLVLSGEQHIKLAWKARGGGYADSVTADGWRSFQSHLAEARASFTKAWNLRPDWPLAPCRMIYVSLGDADITEMRRWFDRTTAAQLDYPKAWTDLRWGLRPRWHGDWNSMRDFGIAALNTRRFDTDVPRKLFDSIWDIEQELELSPREHIYGRDDIWPNLQAMYEGYIAEPTQIGIRDGWRSTYAAVAYLAGKPEVAREQLELLEWKPRTRNFQNWQTDLSLLPLEVAALTGALSNEVHAAETLREGQEFAAALKAYESLADDARADARTREFIQHRIATLTIEERVERGEWVDFLPQRDNDPAWNAQSGDYAVASGGVDVRSGQRGHMIVCRARVGSEFEVRGEFEVVNSSTEDFQAGLVMGMPDTSNTDWLSFRMKRNAREGQVASYSRGWGTSQARSKTDIGATNSFHLRFTDDQLESSVNGKPVHRRAQQPARVRYDYSEFLVGLGAFNDSNETVIRYRNVRLRKLQPAEESVRN